MLAVDKHMWTHAELQLLTHLRKIGRWDFVRIGRRLNLSAIQCSNKYNAIQQRERAERNEKPPERTVPNKVLIDRERRDAARYAQTLTGLTFGDPLPGFSALDQRARA